jgi:hypothetical protein
VYRCSLHQPQCGCAQPDRRQQAPSKQPKELAMQIGEEQEEFEILPEDEQPLALPEHEPHQQPEAAPV